MGAEEVLQFTFSDIERKVSDKCGEGRLSWQRKIFPRGGELTISWIALKSVGSSQAQGKTYVEKAQNHLVC
jgi:hypothetical protein